MAIILSVLRGLWIALLVVTTTGSAVAAVHELDGFVAAAMERYAIPGVAVAVVTDNEVVFARGYGVQQIDRPDRVDENTTFGIGSVTKSFTAAAAAMLVDGDKLAWDTPIIDYISSLHFSDPWLTAHATVRDLVAHRLGVDEPWIYFVRSGDLNRTAQVARYMKPSAPFRTFFYSNTGYGLLGKTIEDTSGRSWDDFITERILKPLDMNHSHSSEYAFIDADKLARCWLCMPPAGTPLGHEALNDRHSNAAVPHGLVEKATAANGAAERVEVLPWRSERSVVSTGMIHSSARDMAQWMMLHLAGGEYRGRRLISTAQMSQIHSAQTIVPEADRDPVDGFKLGGYGMGWFVGTYRGLAASQHGGGRVGFGSQVWLFPEKKLGVVVLQNLDYREGPSRNLIALRFADHYLGMPRNKDAGAAALERAPTASGARAEVCSARAADTHTPDLERHAGTYRNDILGDVQVQLERDRLAIVFEPGSAADLAPAARQSFIACFRGHEQQPTPVRFTYDPSGAATGFVLGQDDSEARSELRFKRIR